MLILQHDQVASNLTVSSGQSHVVLSNLEPRHRYNVRVAGYNSQGVGPYSQDMQVTPEPSLATSTSSRNGNNGNNNNPSSFSAVSSEDGGDGDGGGGAWLVPTAVALLLLLLLAAAAAIVVFMARAVRSANGSPRKNQVRFRR